MPPKPAPIARASEPQKILATGKTDGTLNRIVVGSTALGFAIMLGAVSCLERGANHGFDFRWHWWAIISMALGVAAAVQLWRLVWRMQADDSPRNRSRLGRFCALLLVAGGIVFVYPILFVSRERMGDVIFGLSLAVAVLTFVGWMIHRAFRGFTENDEENKTADAVDRPD